MIPINSPQQKQEIAAVADLIKHEVNIKDIELLEDASDILVKQIKPNYIECIKSSDYTYSSSRILAKLESSSFYGDLTISELRDIYQMCNIEGVRVSAWDIRFGDNILIGDDD